MILHFIQSKFLCLMVQAQRHKDYRQKIISNYQVWDLSWISTVLWRCFSHQLSSLKCFILQPLHRELYNLNPAQCFVPDFLEAIKVNTEISFRKIMSEPSPGVFVFDMLQPSFCEMMLSEVMCILFLFLFLLLSTLFRLPLYSVVHVVLLFWPCRLTILRSGWVRRNSGSWDRTPWINTVQCLTTLVWIPCLTDSWIISYVPYPKAIYNFNHCYKTYHWEKSM